MGEEGVKKGGMVIHGNEYHDPDFEQEGVAATQIETHRTTATHTQDQPPSEHGNEKHNPDFEQEGVAAGLVGTHEAKTTGVHGVGAGTVAKVGDIATDANLSAAAQDAISKRHTQGTDTALGGLGTKNPPIDADKVLQRNSVAGDVLVTSTWTQIKAFLKTYWDTLYEALGAVAAHAALTTGVHSFDKSCHVTRSVAQSIQTNTVTTLTFDTERWDTDAVHDTTTNNSRLTCKTAGKYIIGVNLQFSPDVTGYRWAIILLNGTTNIGALSPGIRSDGYWTAVMNTIWNLEVNNYVEVIVYQTSGVALNIVKSDAFSPEFWLARIG